MYFLNDKHSDYEYTFYIKVKDGTPYLSNCMNSFSDVKRRILEIEKRHNRYSQIFYIDNDFYDNYYNQNCGVSYYYKVLKRKVNDWEEVQTEEEKKNFNNILYFH